MKIEGSVTLPISNDGNFGSFYLHQVECIHKIKRESFQILNFHKHFV